MTSEEFLKSKVKSWLQPFPENVLKDLSQKDREEFRKMEVLALEGEFQQLAEIIVNCTNRFQFAKTYKVLRKSHQDTNAEIRSSKRLSPGVKNVLLKHRDLILPKKLAYMSEWFSMRWDDDIEEYARPVSGCSGVVLALCLGLIAMLCLL